jgi:hypothetical protein
MVFEILTSFAQATVDTCDYHFLATNLAHGLLCSYIDLLPIDRCLCHAKRIGYEFRKYVVYSPWSFGCCVCFPFFTALPLNSLLASFRFWAVALPLMCIVVPTFLWRDIVSMVHYIQKRMAANEAVKV